MTPIPPGKGGRIYSQDVPFPGRISPLFALALTCEGRSRAALSDPRPPHSDPRQKEAPPCAEQSSTPPATSDSRPLDDPKILRPTDAIIRTVATCVCGSDLWPYRGAEPGRANRIRWATNTSASSRRSAARSPTSGRASSSSAPSPPRTTPARTACNGWQSSCLHREFMSTCQADHVRIPNAHGTLVATDGHPDAEMVPGLLAVSDVMGTGWYAALAAEVKPGSTAVVVGDGAVGLCGVIAARELGAERIIAMSRHESRQKLALAFGATDVVAERGEEGVARVQELTGGIGADSVLECVGTPEAMRQALHSARPGGNVGFVGVPHEVAARRRGTVLLPRRPARRPRPRTPLPARPDRPGPVRPDRPGQGLRPHPAPGPGRRGLPGDGRAPRHQGPAQALITRVRLGAVPGRRGPGPETTPTDNPH